MRAINLQEHTAKCIRNLTEAALQAFSAKQQLLPVDLVSNITLIWQSQMPGGKKPTLTLNR